MSSLSTPVTLGGLHLRNRIVMAPLTRCRAGENRVPTPLMAEYYAQRAGAGLIISEATCISPMGVGYRDTPGIWSDEQVNGWRLVTDAVHAAGGLIILQLWHVGRISDPQLLAGELPVAPSAINPGGQVRLLRPVRDHVTPRALGIDEIPLIVEQYRQAAANARLAGFDGVEIHGANGYLIDQFLQDSSNQREDEYGGSIDNRCRFLAEVFDAVNREWPAERIGLHLSPRGDMHNMGDRDPAALFSHVARMMRDKGAAFIFLRESPGEDSLLPQLKEAFAGPVIANEKLTGAQAKTLVETEAADAVSFGRLFIANPDLVTRLVSGAELNAPDDATFYGRGELGYTDYPELS